MSDDVAEIKRRLDIFDYISRFIKLKRSGRNFAACCPFHQEKTPSFYVYPDKQTFSCYGCGKWGDIFTFAMQYENFDFLDAKEHLAKEAGYTLTHKSGGKRNNKEDDERWDFAMKTALDYFRECYRGVAGEAARQYIQGRRFKHDTIELFNIGYAPDEYDGLLNHCRRRGISIEDLILLGLCKKNESGHVFDFFRNRVMFPVLSQTGRIVAFGGRVLGDEKPKYLNSPETPLFIKSKLFYNFKEARDSVRNFGHYLLMEGYTDVMMARQENLGPSIATLGTAMTEDHALILRRQGMPVYLVYDGDKAGQNATERSLPHFLKVGLDVKVVTLPNKEDPCEFLLNNSNAHEIWKKLLVESKDVFTFKLERLIGAMDSQDPESFAQVADEMLQDLRHCKDPVRIDLYLRQLGERLGIDKQALRQKLDPKVIVAKPREPSLSLAEKVMRQLPQANFKKDECFYLLAILVTDQSYVAELEEQSQHLVYPDTPTAKLLQKLLGAHHGSHDMALHTLTQTLNDDEKQLLGMANAQDIPTEPDILRAMFFEKVSLLRRPNDEASTKLALKRATAEKNYSEVRRLTQELQKLRRPQGTA